MRRSNLADALQIHQRLAQHAVVIVAGVGRALRGGASRNAKRSGPVECADGGVLVLWEHYRWQGRFGFLLVFFDTDEFGAIGAERVVQALRRAGGFLWSGAAQWQAERGSELVEFIVIAVFELG